jgi:hypothetical protein
MNTFVKLISNNTINSTKLLNKYLILNSIIANKNIKCINNINRYLFTYHKPIYLNSQSISPSIYLSFYRRFSSDSDKVVIKVSIYIYIYINASN